MLVFCLCCNKFSTKSVTQNSTNMILLFCSEGQGLTWMGCIPSANSRRESLSLPVLTAGNCLHSSRHDPFFHVQSQQHDIFSSLWPPWSSYRTHLYDIGYPLHLEVLITCAFLPDKGSFAPLSLLHLFYGRYN